MVRLTGDQRLHAIELAVQVAGLGQQLTADGGGLFGPGGIRLRDGVDLTNGF